MGLLPGLFPEISDVKLGEQVCSLLLWPLRRHCRQLCHHRWGMGAVLDS